jgi:ubiquitin C-terminal hydrolase
LQHNHVITRIDAHFEAKRDVATTFDETTRVAAQFEASREFETNFNQMARIDAFDSRSRIEAFEVESGVSLPNHTPESREEIKSEVETVHGTGIDVFEVDDAVEQGEASFGNDSAITARGLLRIGQTCYFNALVQGFSSLKSVCSKRSAHTARCSHEFCFGCESLQVFRKLNHNGSPLMLNFTSQLHRLESDFTLHKQQDVHELLTLLLDKIDCQTKQESFVKQIFSFNTDSFVTCAVCQNIFCTSLPTKILSLPIRSSRSVRKAVSEFTRSENLFGANQYRCLFCNKNTDATKNLNIRCTSDAIIFHLRRFSFDGQARKIKKHISFSDTMLLDDCRWNLRAVIVHLGRSINGGHFVVFKRTDDLWWHIDDDKVQETSFQAVQESEAYILFWEKETAREKLAQRGKQRKRNADSLAKYRENETTPQREKRRKKNTEAVAKQRKNETTPQRVNRRKRNTEAVAKQRENETTPQRGKRRKMNTEALAKQREKQSTPESEKQRKMNTAALAKQREKETER